MSFKLFIYYCAICGGWAAFLAFGLVLLAGLNADSVTTRDTILKATGIAMILGVLLAAVIATLDAIMNATGFQRVVRVLLALGIGTVGALVGGVIGESLHQATLSNGLLASTMQVVGWMLVGLVIGASIGIFDVLQAMKGGSIGPALKKTLNGINGGVLGGFVGGTFFVLMLQFTERLPRSSLAAGLVLLGLCIGLFIGLAQVILKEAWLRVEKGFRAGRELILAKPEITIGRGEGNDIGLFGDSGVDKQHARIVLKNNRYLLIDNDTATGTYLNDERIDGPTPLKSGDEIRLGNSLLRFGERQKRK